MHSILDGSERIQAGAEVSAQAIFCYYLSVIDDSWQFTAKGYLPKGIRGMLSVRIRELVHEIDLEYDSYGQKLLVLENCYRVA